MSRTFPCRSGRRSASVVWRTGGASDNTVLCRRRVGSYILPGRLTTTRCRGGIVVDAQAAMRSPIRTIVVLVLAAGLIALFLSNVDLRRVVSEIFRARPEWLALSLASMFVNLSIRALRWKYLLEPLGPTSFATAFRATAVGFAASSLLPARAGELIRPYFLARQSRHQSQAAGLTATGAFATIILERLLDIVTVLVLLASFVFVFGRDLAESKPGVFAALKWAGATAGAGSLTALVVLFVLAG